MSSDSHPTAWQLGEAAWYSTAAGAASKRYADISRTQLVPRTGYPLVPLVDTDIEEPYVCIDTGPSHRKCIWPPAYIFGVMVRLFGKHTDISHGYTSRVMEGITPKFDVEVYDWDKFSPEEKQWAIVNIKLYGRVKLVIINGIEY